MANQGARREGWYADPLGQADLRWWDSQNWTTEVTSSRAENTRPGAATRTPPLRWADDEPTERELRADAGRVAPPTTAPAADPQFALGSKPATVGPKAEPDATGGPDWSPLMRALLTAGTGIVTATAGSIPIITIDMTDRTYWWDWSLDSFPAHPVDLVVNTTPRADAIMPAVAGRYIEPLLWRIGTGAEALSERVDTSLRYKLRRWPDLASLPHTADQLRAIKVLASAQLTPIELGALAEIDLGEARRLVGTFSLMSLLDSVRDPAATR